MKQIHFLSKNKPHCNFADKLLLLRGGGSDYLPNSFSALCLKATQDESPIDEQFLSNNFVEDKNVTTILLLRADLLRLTSRLLKNNGWRFHLKVPRWIFLFHHFSKENTPGRQQGTQGWHLSDESQPRALGKAGLSEQHSTGRAAGSNKPPSLRDSGKAELLRGENC